MCAMISAMRLSTARSLCDDELDLSDTSIILCRNTIAATLCTCIGDTNIHPSTNAAILFISTQKYATFHENKTTTTKRENGQTWKLFQRQYMHLLLVHN